MSNMILQSGPLDIDSSDYYNALASATPVSLIHTTKDKLKTCALDDSVEEVLIRPELTDFDNIPVVNNGSIIGLFERSSDLRQGHIQNAYRTLHPDLLIGEAAPIFKFIERADHHNCCFVVGKDGISGMVTVSDLQKLPVQVALFGLIAQFELQVSELLRRGLKDSDNKHESVLKHIDKQAVAHVRRIKKMNDEKNLSIDWVTPLTLKLKLDALKSVDSKALPDWSQAYKIRDLRDSIAHYHGFAQTYDLLMQLVHTKRALFVLVRELSIQLAEMGSAKVPD